MFLIHLADAFIIRGAVGGARTLITTTCDDGRTYVNPDQCQGFAFGSTNVCTEEERPYISGIELTYQFDPVVFAFNDKDENLPASMFDGVGTYSQYKYGGFVLCEVYHGERINWKCNKNGQHDKCDVDDYNAMNFDEDGKIFSCSRYNAYALGKAADTTTFWSWDTNDAQNHHITRCGKWRFETIDGLQVKKLNPDFDCACKPVGDGNYVYPWPAGLGHANQPYRWAIKQQCDTMTCASGQHARGCVMPRPASIPQNDLLTMMGGYAAGTTSHFGSCVNCENGKYKVGSNKATSCSACASCSAGQVRTGCGASPWTSAGVCVNCAAGKYKSTPGAWNTVCTDCPPCPTNEIQNTDKCGVSPFTSAGKCECKPGYSRDKTGGTCVVCDRGKYKDWIGDALGDLGDSNKGCKQCPSSEMSTDTVGSTSSDDCNCKSVRNKIQVGSQCIQCAFTNNYQAPVKEIGQSEVCLECPFDKYFVSPDCVSIPIMQFDCEGAVVKLDPVEDKRKFSNEIIIVPVESEHYLDTSTYEQALCDYCGTYRYADACGRPETDEGIKYLWVRNNDTNQLFKQELNGNYLTTTGPVTCTLPTGSTNYVTDTIHTIERQGKCMDCTLCSNSNEYNSGCPQNKGICTSCEPATPCDLSKQWFDHALADGCRDEKATTPYFCVDCVSWQKVNGGDIMLFLGCAETGYVRWHPDVGETVVPNTLTCAWDGSAWSGHSDCVGLTYSKYDSGIAIPYCPPGWFVDETCVSSQTTTTPWNSNCCKRCGASCRPAGETKKSASYSQCDGAGTDDTEICVQRCENGYYADQAEQQCKRCQMCGQT